MIGASYAAIFEALVLGVKAGVPAQTLYDVIGTIAVGGPFFRNCASLNMQRRFRGTGSHLGTMYKDLCISMDVARANGVPMFTAAAAKELFQAGIARFPGEDNWAIVNFNGIPWDTPLDSELQSLYCTEEPFPTGYERGRRHIRHIHVKDVHVDIPRARVQFRELGTGHLAPYLVDITAPLRRDGYPGVVSLEANYDRGAAVPPATPPADGRRMDESSRPSAIVAVRWKPGTGRRIRSPDDCPFA